MQNIIILSTQRKPLEFHFLHQSLPRTNSVSTPYHLPMVLPNTSLVGTPLTQIVFPHRRPNVHLAVEIHMSKANRGLSGLRRVLEMLGHDWYAACHAKSIKIQVLIAVLPTA